MMRFERRQHRLLEFCQARPIEPQPFGGSLELNSLFSGDHTISQYIGEQVLIRRLEGPKLYPQQVLGTYETLGMLKCNAIGHCHGATPERTIIVEPAQRLQ